MKHAVTFLFCSSATVLFATANPPELGNFEGVLMTGAAIVQPVLVEGGTLSACEAKGSESRPIHKCTTTGGRISVSAQGETLVFTLDKVTVLKSKLTHYYYRGNRVVRIANTEVVQPISATVNHDPAKPDRVFGYLTLSETELKSSFEAYRKN